MGDSNHPPTLSLVHDSVSGWEGRGKAEGGEESPELSPGYIMVVQVKYPLSKLADLSLTHRMLPCQDTIEAIGHKAAFSLRSSKIVFYNFYISSRPPEFDCFYCIIQYSEYTQCSTYIELVYIAHSSYSKCSFCKVICFSSSGTNLFFFLL